MGSEATLRDVYDAQLQTVREVAGMRTDLAAYTAKTDERLGHGDRRMGELSGRIKDIEDDVGTLKAEGQRRGGMSAAVQAILTIGGGSTSGAIVAWLLTLLAHH